MDVDELREWAAYARIEPFLRDVLPHELAALRVCVASPWSKRKLSLDDMLLDWGASQQMKPQTTGEMRAALAGLMSAAQESKRG